MVLLRNSNPALLSNLQVNEDTNPTTYFTTTTTTTSLMPSHPNGSSNGISDNTMLAIIGSVIGSCVLLTLIFIVHMIKKHNKQKSRVISPMLPPTEKPMSSTSKILHLGPAWPANNVPPALIPSSTTTSVPSPSAKLRTGQPLPHYPTIRPQYTPQYTRAQTMEQDQRDALHRSIFPRPPRAFEESSFETEAYQQQRHLSGALARTMSRNRPMPSILQPTALLSEIHRLPTERTSRFNNSILSHYDRIEMEMDESSYEYKAPEPLDGVPLSNEVVVLRKNYRSQTLPGATGETDDNSVLQPLRGPTPRRRSSIAQQFVLAQAQGLQ